MKRAGRSERAIFAGRSIPLSATVIKVGPQFEAAPTELLQDPRRPEWVLPIRVSFPAALNARPGELVDLMFDLAAAMARATCLLRSNYRFSRDSAIAELAGLVNHGDDDAALELLQRNERGLHWFDVTGDRLHDDARAWLYDAYQGNAFFAMLGLSLAGTAFALALFALRRKE